MNKFVLCFLLSLLITGCKKDGWSPSQTISQPSTALPDINTPGFPLTGTKEDQLTFLINEFKNHYSVTWSNINTIDFKPNSYMNPTQGQTTTVGVCEVYSDGSKQIHFNQDWWPTSSEIQKRILVYHELGHCYFQRAHDNRLYSGNRPYSIMYSILDPVVSYYPSYKTYYLDELKNPTVLNIINKPLTFRTNQLGECSEELVE